MKIVITCMQFVYGEMSRGLSYEYINFYTVLRQMGHEVILFDYLTETAARGKAGMNQSFYDLVQQERPELTFFILFTDQFEPDMVKKLGDLTTTLCFFHDDTWRVEYSRFWAAQFNYFTTPDVYGEYKYHTLGLNHALYFPFGCNPSVFPQLNVKKKHDVSFVGAFHPVRAWLIQAIRDAGVQVKVAGLGWPSGELDHDGMVQLFNESKINLNLSNSTSWDIRYLKSSLRALVNSYRSPKTIEQLKARHFEISSCGGFQLSYYVEGLERQYVIGEEIAIYLDRDDLLRKIKFYLADDALRERISSNAYKRSMLDHTFESRFKQIFSRMGFEPS